MENLLKEIIERIDPEEHYRNNIDFQSCVLLMPSQDGKVKIAFWDKNDEVVMIECFGFIPIKMNYSHN
jgi:hypothetical protein